MTTPSPQPTKSTELVVKLLWFAPLLIMTALIAACNSLSHDVFNNKISEGVIEYKISFPDVSSESLTATLMPETMIYAFNENSFASHFEAAGGVFKNRIIANRETGEVEHQLKVFRKKIKVMMNETDVLKMLAEYPKMTVIETEETDTIAGYLCKKALIIFEEIDMPEIEVYHTSEIKMKKPNWCTQYHQIEGVLMAYEIEEFGIRMRLEAISVEPKKLEPELLQPQEEYTTISKEMMDVELAQLVETFEL